MIKSLFNICVRYNGCNCYNEANCKCRKLKLFVSRELKHLKKTLNPLNPKLNPICYLLALLGAHHFLHVSR